MDKEDVEYIYIYMMEYYLSIKNENVICSNMDEPRDYHTKWGKLDRERWILHDITHVESLKVMQMNLFTNQK